MHEDWILHKGNAIITNRMYSNTNGGRGHQNALGQLYKLYQKKNGTWELKKFLNGLQLPSITLDAFDGITHPDTSWPATNVSYDGVPLRLLRLNFAVHVPLRVLWEYAAATLYCMHGTAVTEAAVYPQSTLNGTLTRSSLSGTRVIIMRPT